MSPKSQLTQEQKNLAMDVMRQLIQLGATKTDIKCILASKISLSEFLSVVVSVSSINVFLGDLCVEVPEMSEQVHNILMKLMVNLNPEAKFEIHKDGETVKLQPPAVSADDDSDRLLIVGVLVCGRDEVVRQCTIPHGIRLKVFLAKWWHLFKVKAQIKDCVIMKSTSDPVFNQVLDVEMFILTEEIVLGIMVPERTVDTVTTLMSELKEKDELILDLKKQIRADHKMQSKIQQLESECDGLRAQLKAHASSDTANLVKELAESISEMKSLKSLNSQLQSEVSRLTMVIKKDSFQKLQSSDNFQVFVKDLHGKTIYVGICRIHLQTGPSIQTARNSSLFSHPSERPCENVSENLFT